MQDCAREPAVKLIQEEFPTSPCQAAPNAGHSLHEREERQLSLHPPGAGQALGDRPKCPDLQAFPAQCARQDSLTEGLDPSGGCNAGTPCGAAVPCFMRDFMEHGMETEKNLVRGNLLPPPHLPPCHILGITIRTQLSGNL